MTTTTVTPADAAPGDGAGGDGSGPAAGRCKRGGCLAPLPPAERGRSRQFCSDECRRRHYNALRGTAGGRLRRRPRTGRGRCWATWPSCWPRRPG